VPRLGASATLLFACIALAPCASSQTKPNIVLIVADDLGYGDVGPYDDDHDPSTPMVTNTPRLDELAQAGVRLTDFYAGAPVCTPTRAALITGRYNARIGMLGVLGPNFPCGLPVSEITLAELVKTRGYATALIGKWHLGSVPQFGPLQQGFDTYYGLDYSNDQTPYVVLQDDAPVDPCPDQAHLMQSLLVEAENFVAAAVSQSKPFFLYMPTIAPHVPVYTSPEFDGITGRGLYADCVNEMDWCIGHLIDHLTKLGIARDTIVIFTSDNGPWHNTHLPPPDAPDPWRWVGGSAGPLKGSKAMVYEGGIREPFIACWPGHFAAGATIQDPAICMDLFPTLALAAGATLPTDRVLDGRDIGPLLAGTGTRGASDFCFYQLDNRCETDTTDRRLWAVRSGKWKLIFDETCAPSELYDLDADIGETTPLHLPSITAMLLDKAHDIDCGMDAPPTSFPPSNDLAMGRPTFASSSVGCSTSGKAVDGVESTYWTSASCGDEWMYVDLGATCDVERVVLTWGASYAAVYSIDASNDAAHWSTVHASSHGTGGHESIALSGVLARYVRVHELLPAHGASYSLGQLEVYGTAQIPGTTHHLGQHH